MRLIMGTVALLAIMSLAVSASASGPTKLKQPSSFPLVISKSGSYVLASDITVPSANTTAISVQADNVTIDLNGFSILGPGTSGSGNGIDVPGGQNTAVLNGSVQGMGNNGLSLNGGRIDGVRALRNGGDGIDCGQAGVVSNSIATLNGRNGIDCHAGGVVSNSIAQSNGFAASGGDGISGATVSGCEADTNASAQISAPAIAGHNNCNGSPCP